MPIYDAARAEHLQDAAARERVSPFLTDTFDPIVLERPGFLAEVGLESGDAELLRIGVVAQARLRHPLFWRALAEEIRACKQELGEFLSRFGSAPADGQWMVALRVVLRMRQLGALPADKAATALDVKKDDAQAQSRALPAPGSPEEVDLVLAVMLVLLGVSAPRQALVQGVAHQLHRTTLLFFETNTPDLTHLEQGPTEVEVRAGERVVRQSLAKLLDEAADLGPELWSARWMSYIAAHPHFTADEIEALLDHLRDRDRIRWPLKVAAGNTKARRAVVAVTLAALEALAPAQGGPWEQRMLGMFDDFSERYDLEAVLKQHRKS